MQAPENSFSGRAPGGLIAAWKQNRPLDISFLYDELGAATAEAQENVAVQVAEQMADFLLTGAVSNAINMPSITAEEAKQMGLVYSVSADPQAELTSVLRQRP